jgi:hypothetical protein
VPQRFALLVQRRHQRRMAMASAVTAIPPAKSTYSLPC